MSDEELMRRALELAARGMRLAAPNPMVGCVIARDGQILAEGFHERDGGPHAEQQALACLPDGCAGAAAFVTLEPCAHEGRTPSCAALLAQAKPARVAVAAQDPDPRTAGAGIAAMRAAGIDVAEGLLAGEARQQNRGYFSRQERGRPWLLIKTAASIDGRIALPDGTSRWITSQQARQDVHNMRACSCAIATGIGTALADDPLLTARIPDIERQPLRVLFDSKMRATAQLRMLAEPGAVVFTAAEGKPAGLPDCAQVVQLPDSSGKVDLRAALEWLAQKRKCNSVMVEAGGRLAGAFLQADLVDEAVCYVAPMVIGDGPSAIECAAPAALDQCRRFELRSIGQVGPDIKAVYARSGAGA